MIKSVYIYSYPNFLNKYFFISSLFPTMKHEVFYNQKKKFLKFISYNIKYMKTIPLWGGLDSNATAFRQKAKNLQRNDPK